jgi:hypothetical protein
MASRACDRHREHSPNLCPGVVSGCGEPRPPLKGEDADQLSKFDQIRASTGRPPISEVIRLRGVARVSARPTLSENRP